MTSIQKQAAWSREMSSEGNSFRKNQRILDFKDQGIYCNPFVFGCSTVEDPVFYQFSDQNIDLKLLIQHDPCLMVMFKIVKTSANVRRRVYDHVGKLCTAVGALAAPVDFGATAAASASSFWVLNRTSRYLFPADDELKLEKNSLDLTIGDTRVHLEVHPDQTGFSVSLEMVDIESGASHLRKLHYDSIDKLVTFIFALSVYSDNPKTGVFVNRGNGVCHCLGIGEIDDEIESGKGIVKSGRLNGKYKFMDSIRK